MGLKSLDMIEYSPFVSRAVKVVETLLDIV